MCGCNGTAQAETWVVIKGGTEVYAGDQAGAQTYAIMNGGLAQKKTG